MTKKCRTVIIIVAHPDDEILWAGGTILSHTSWNCFVLCLCRGSDEDRAPRFRNVLNIIKVKGVMGDLDDEPEQNPLNEAEVENAILKLLPTTHFDLIITHSAKGEYTRHLRHEETNKAVIKLWHTGKLQAHELWTFAYEDGHKSYFPMPIHHASIFTRLTEKIWLRKYYIITEIYGFAKESWEARTTPKAEAFWKFENALNAYKSLPKKGSQE
ncbi:MAG: PIG-L family deacetylase [Bacteroidales bacterium]